VRAAATKAGAGPQGGRFRAHVTLARCRRPDEATRWLRVLDTYRGPPWQVSQVSLLASHLGEGPGGRPRHEVVEVYPLGRQRWDRAGPGRSPGRNPGVAG
ncbi:MAG: hypothetical protein WB798_11455, partial [Nocardioidaceae bacterium]